MINPENVEAIFKDCLLRDEEDIADHVAAEGVIHNAAFHPERLESHRAAIEEMLDELPDEFKKSKGGGWSFLNACVDKHGNQWTGLHVIMEQLIQLGIGIKKVKPSLPRTLWEVLPGGMPYYVVLDS